MPVSPQNTLGTVRSVGTYTSGNGYNVLKGLTNIEKSNSPVNSPPILLGSDSATINTALNPRNLLTFPNLIKRTNSANSLTNLTAQGQELDVPPGATLQYILSGVTAMPVVLMELNGQIFRIGGGTLGSGHYRLFQAQVDPSITTGVVYAQLYYQA